MPSFGPEPGPSAPGRPPCTESSPLARGGTSPQIDLCSLDGQSSRGGLPKTGHKSGLREPPALSQHSGKEPFPMNRKHTLFAILVTFGLIACETDEPTRMLDLEVAASADGISLTDESTRNLEEWAEASGFMDTPTRLRVVDSEGKVLREVNGDSFVGALGEMRPSGDWEAGLQQRAAEVLEGLKSGEIPLPDSAELAKMVKSFEMFFEKLEPASVTMESVRVKEGGER